MSYAAAPSYRHRPRTRLQQPPPVRRRHLPPPGSPASDPVPLDSPRISSSPARHPQPHQSIKIGRPCSCVPAHPQAGGAAAAGLRPARGPAGAFDQDPHQCPLSARNDSRTWRSGLSTLRSTSATDCQVPRASRPPITGSVAYGGTKAGSTCDRPCPRDPCACRQWSSAGSSSARVASRSSSLPAPSSISAEARGGVRHEHVQQPVAPGRRRRREPRAFAGDIPDRLAPAGVDLDDLRLHAPDHRVWV